MVKLTVHVYKIILDIPGIKIIYHNITLEKQVLRIKSFNKNTNLICISNKNTQQSSDNSVISNGNKPIEDILMQLLSTQRG